MIDNLDTSQSDPQFSVISESDPITSTFSKIDKSTPTNAKGEQFCTDSISSIKEAKKAKQGKTREEAMLGLNIKKAELMETGEIKLGNGKIIGHRAFAYIYKQKYRVAD